LAHIADYFSFAPAERPSNPLREISGYVPANLVAARDVIRAQHDVSSALLGITVPGYPHQLAEIIAGHDLRPARVAAVAGRRSVAAWTRALVLTGE
jgi:hypothetical protein